MSEPAQATFYGVKAARTDELVPLAEAGDVIARDELRTRLKPQLLELIKLYIAAYGSDGTTKALVDDMASFKIPA